MLEMGGRWNAPPAPSLLARRLGGWMGGSLIVSPSGRDDVGEMEMELSAPPGDCAECADDTLKRDVVEDSGLGYGE